MDTIMYSVYENIFKVYVLCEIHDSILYLNHIQYIEISSPSLSLHNKFGTLNCGIDFKEFEFVQITKCDARYTRSSQKLLDRFPFMTLCSNNNSSDFYTSNSSITISPRMRNVYTVEQVVTDYSTP